MEKCPHWGTYASCRNRTLFFTCLGRDRGINKGLTEYGPVQAVSVTLAPLIKYSGEKQLWPDIGGCKSLRGGVIVQSDTRKHNDNCIDNPSVLKILNWDVWSSASTFRRTDTDKLKSERHRLLRMIDTQRRN